MDVVVIDPNLPAVRDELEAALAAASPGARVAWHPRYDAAAVARDLPGTEVLVASRYTSALAEHSGALRLLQCPAAGLDAIDLSALPPGVLLANTGHHERSIAEHVLAAVVVLRRRLRQHDEALRRRGEWATPLGVGLDGARVGFVGFGAIGRATWAPFRALGARGAAVTGSGRAAGSVAEEHGLEWAGRTDEDLDRLVTESDVLVLSAPLLPETTGLLDARVLALAPPGAVVVNVGRGPLVVEDALYEALESGHLGGAVVDVWWSYPRGRQGLPGSRDWAALEHVVASPHSSGMTRQTLLARVADIAENVRRLGAGEPLLNARPR